MRYNPKAPLTYPMELPKAELQALLKCFYCTANAVTMYSGTTYCRACAEEHIRTGKIN